MVSVEDDPQVTVLTFHAACSGGAIVSRRLEATIRVMVFMRTPRGPAYFFDVVAAFSRFSFQSRAALASPKGRIRPRVSACTSLQCCASDADRWN
jgi:hypothetical protein